MIIKYIGVKILFSMNTAKVISGFYAVMGGVTGSTIGYYNMKNMRKISDNPILNRIENLKTVIPKTACYSTFWPFAWTLMYFQYRDDWKSDLSKEFPRLLGPFCPDSIWYQSYHVCRWRHHQLVLPSFVPQYKSSS